MKFTNIKKTKLEIWNLHHFEALCASNDRINSGEDMLKRLSSILVFLLFITIVSSCPNSLSPANAQSAYVPGFSCYRDLSTIYDRIQQLQNKYPDLLTVTDIGDSWEKQNLGMNHGHDLLILKLEANPSPKPTLILISGLKANSFGPVEINLRFAEFLLSAYPKQSDVRYLIDHFAVHFLFVANPDGRTKAESQADGTDNTWTITWAKNTNPSGCASDDGGVALEHNFSYQWNNLPTDPCASDYPGLQAFSEPETQAIRDYLQELGQTNPNNHLLINLESYGDFILNPYLYSKTNIVPQYYDYQVLANKLAYGQEVMPLEHNNTAIPEKYGTLIDYTEEIQDIKAIQYRLGSQMGGGNVSSCGYFEDVLVEPALQSLLRALKTLPEPLAYGAGPEIHNLSVNLNFNESLIEISGQLDAHNYYRHTNRTTSISALRYSIDLPPWHPDAEENLLDFERDLEYPGLADFFFQLDMNTINPEGATIYFQGEAEYCANGYKRKGFVEMVTIKLPNPELNLYLPLIITSR